MRAPTRVVIGSTARSSGPLAPGFIPSPALGLVDPTLSAARFRLWFVVCVSCVSSSPPPCAPCLHRCVRDTAKCDEYGLAPQARITLTSVATNKTDGMEEKGKEGGRERTWGTKNDDTTETEGVQREDVDEKEGEGWIDEGSE